MSVWSLSAHAAARPLDRMIATTLAGVALLAGLLCALSPGVPAAAAILVAVVGACATAALLLGQALRACTRRPVLLVVVLLIGLAVAWVLVGIGAASQIPVNQYQTGNGMRT